MLENMLEDTTYDTSRVEIKMALLSDSLYCWALTFGQYHTVRHRILTVPQV